MEAYLEWLRGGVDSVGIWFVLPFLVLENIPVIGLFAPGLTVLILSGFFHELLVSHVALLYLLAIITIIVADNVWYWIGYSAHRNSVWFQKLLAQAPEVADVLTRQPWYGLYLYQFVPYFRMFLPFALGAYRFSPVRWLGITLVGSTLYVGVFLSIGVIGASLIASIEVIDSITSNINNVIAVGALIYVIYLYRQVSKLRK